MGTESVPGTMENFHTVTWLSAPDNFLTLTWMSAPDSFFFNAVVIKASKPRFSENHKIQNFMSILSVGVEFSIRIDSQV
jgi:hypothetical protein